MVEASNDRLRKFVSTLNHAELVELIGMAEQERTGKLEDARRSLMAEFDERAAAVGLTTEQLFGQSRGTPEKAKRGRKGEASPKASSSPAAVKFRSQSGQTWSGRGRKPTWLTQAEASGHSPEEFRVHE